MKSPDPRQHFDERPTPSQERMVGKTVSHFKILEWLGGGGMGVVYRAEDERLGRSVALKFLPPHLHYDAQARRRFVQEARTASRLDHPNICTVYEIDESADGRTFIAMAYYEGSTLKKLLSQGPLPPDRAAPIALQILSGLEAAHELGIVHRDIKPANIFVTADGVVKILDFGVARVSGTNLTGSGVLLGTVPYMSPEQVRNEEIDLRTDIWSFGVLLFEMLSGRKPFGDSYELAVLYSIVNSAHEPLPESLPAGIRSIVDKCLAKEKSDRYASTNAVREDLSAQVPEISAAAGGESEVRALPRSRLARAGFAAILILVVSVMSLWAFTPGDENLFRWVTSFVGGSIDSPAEKHLAVLPFAPVGIAPSGKAEPDAFADGLFEMLTSKLSQMQPYQTSLWVVPASEIRSRRIQSVEAARKAFAITLAVTGSVARSGNEIRLYLNLVDAVTLRQLNARTIEGQLSDVVAFQDRVVGALIELVEIESGIDPRSLRDGDTVVPGAFEYYIQGRGFLRAHDQLESVETSIVLFSRAIEADRRFALAHAALGEALWRKYRFTKEHGLIEMALAHCDTAATLSGNLAPVLVSIGVVQAGTGSYEKALETFERARNLEPRNADVYRERGRAYEALAVAGDQPSRHEEAELSFRRALALRPDYPFSYAELGMFYFRRGRYPEAVEQFTLALELAPESAQTYHRLGSTYALMKEFAKAAQAFERSIQIEPTFAGYLNLGTFYYYYERNYDRAGETYQKAIELNPRDYRTWGWLGEAYYWSSSYRHRAKTAFQQAILAAEEERRVNPRNAALLSRLAAYYAYLGSHEEARENIDSAMQLGSADGEVLAHAAEVFLRLGDTARAAELLHEALTMGFDSFYVDNSPMLKAVLSYGDSTHSDVAFSN